MQGRITHGAICAMAGAPVVRGPPATGLLIFFIKKVI